MQITCWAEKLSKSFQKVEEVVKEIEDGHHSQGSVKYIQTDTWMHDMPENLAKHDVWIDFFDLN